MENQPDIAYKITTSADNSGLAAHTAAVKADTAAVREQAVAYQALSNTGSGLATSPAGMSQAMAKGGGAYTIKNEAEYAQAQKLITSYQQLARSKEMVGVADAQLTARIAALDAALSTESAITIAETMETRALAQAEVEASVATVSLADANKILAMSAGGAAAGGIHNMRMEMRTLHMAMAPLAGQMMPGMTGQLAYMVAYGLNPWVLALTAAGVGAYEFSQIVKEVQKTESELTSILTKGTDTLIKRIEIADKYREAAAQLKADLAEASKMEWTAAESFARTNSKLSEQVKLFNDVADAHEKMQKAKIAATEGDPAKRAMEEFMVEQNKASAAEKNADKETLQKTNALKLEQANVQITKDNLQQKSNQEERALKHGEILAAHYKSLKESLEEITKKRDDLTFLMASNLKESLSPSNIAQSKVIDEAGRKARQNLTDFETQNAKEFQPGGGLNETSMAALKIQHNQTVSDLKKATDDFAKVVKNFDDDLKKILDEQSARQQEFHDSQIAALYTLEKTLTEQAKSREQTVGGDMNDPQLRELAGMLSWVKQAVAAAEAAPAPTATPGTQALPSSPFENTGMGYFPDRPAKPSYKGPSRSIIAGAINAEATFDTTGAMSDDQQALIDRLTELLEKQHLSVLAIFEVIGRGLANHETQKQILNEVTTKINQLQTQISAPL